ncbi:hypothetical protein DFH28DRAFT_25560 [Melampsora americana]|nr:hypothetical protein DFH28DRAFT_25560 [Melampsora americana]
MKEAALAKKISPNQSNRNQHSKNNQIIKLIHHSLQSQLQSPSQEPQLQLQCTSEWPNFNSERSNLVLKNLIEIFKIELTINQNLMIKPNQLLIKNQHSSIKLQKTLRTLNSWILDYLVLGLNSIYKTLNSIRNQLHSGLKLNRKSNLSLILICKEDLWSNDLILHLPLMINSINFISSQLHRQTHPMIHLLELPIGSSLILSQFIGIKSCTALAILDDMPGLDNLLQVLLPEKVEGVEIR